MTWHDPDHLTRRDIENLKYEIMKARMTEPLKDEEMDGAKLIGTFKVHKISNGFVVNVDKEALFCEDAGQISATIVSFLVKKKLLSRGK